MAIRNFWIDASIDGRKTRLAGGPQSKDGGFDLTVYIREQGQIRKAVFVSGSVDSDGGLRLTVSPCLPYMLPDETWGSIDIRSRR